MQFQPMVIADGISSYYCFPKCKCAHTAFIVESFNDKRLIVDQQKLFAPEIVNNSDRSYNFIQYFSYFSFY